MVTTRKDAEVIFADMSGQLFDSFDNYSNNHPWDFTTMSYDEAFNILSDILYSMKCFAKCIEIEGYSFAQYVASYTATEKDGKLDKVTLTIRSGIKSPIKFSYVVDCTPETLMKDIFDAHNTALIHMLKLNIATENITELNAELDELSADSDIGFNFTLGDCYVEDINDKVVTFGISIDSAFDIADLSILRKFDVPMVTASEPEEGTGDVAEEVQSVQEEFEDTNSFMKEVVAEERAEIVKALEGRTTAQLLKAGIPLVIQLTGLKPKSRIDKLLRKKYHTQAKFFGSRVKGATGYVLKDVTIDGEEVKIFALLNKSADGEVTVKLSPFNIATTFNVDYAVAENYID